MCLYPKIVKNPKYRPNKKNKGQVPQPADERVMYMPVGCGLCMECMKQKSNEWKVRLAEDIKTNTNGKFVTLTFSNEAYTELTNKVRQKLGPIEGYNLDNEIAALAVREFLERWRKKYKKSVRHWLVTELGSGETEHLHLHGIIWTDNDAAIEERWNATSYGGNGWATIGDGRRNYVNNATITYISKYITKVDPAHKYYKPKIFASAGIGKRYTETYNFKKNEFKGQETNTLYKTAKGHEIAMPIYWRNKRYTEEEREKLWLQRLDQNTRYVCGEKVKADNEEEYQKLLKFYRKRNTELGYGNPEDWDAQKYEHERRLLKQAKRMTNKDKGVGIESQHTRVIQSNKYKKEGTQDSEPQIENCGMNGRVCDSKCERVCVAAAATALAARAPSGQAFQRNSITVLSRTSAQDKRGAEPINNSVINWEQPGFRREAISPAESRTIDWEKEIPF